MHVVELYYTDCLEAFCSPLLLNPNEGVFTIVYGFYSLLKLSRALRL